MAEDRNWNDNPFRCPSCGRDDDKVMALAAERDALKADRDQWIAAALHGDELLEAELSALKAELATARELLGDVAEKDIRLWRACGRLVGWARQFIADAPGAADFAIGGKYDYDTNCGNVDDVWTLAVASRNRHLAAELGALLEIEETGEPAEPDRMKCRTCGEMFDLRILDQVIFHESHEAHEPTMITGQRVSKPCEQEKTK